MGDQLTDPIYELLPAIYESPEYVDIYKDDGHEHHWDFGAIVPNQRQHLLTQQTVTMISIIMTCWCGTHRHSWAGPPPTPQADAQRAEGKGPVDPRIVGGKPS